MFHLLLDWRSQLQIGNSLFDQEGAKIVHDLVEKAKKNHVELFFPVDYVTADRFDKDAQVRQSPALGLLYNGYILHLDIA